jgi:hypothetical protein
MKRIIFVILLLLASGIFAGANAADFSGSWSLDMKQSKNLPPFYATIKSHKLAITQGEKQLTVAVDIDAGRGETDKFNFIYNLDGSDSKTETQIRTPNGLTSVPTVLNAKAGTGGMLQITITRSITLPDRSFKGITIEDWELSTDGKILTIKRTDELPNGKVTAELIFLKS